MIFKVLRYSIISYKRYRYIYRYLLDEKGEPNPATVLKFSRRARVENPVKTETLRPSVVLPIEYFICGKFEKDSGFFAFVVENSCKRFVVWPKL